MLLGRCYLDYVTWTVLKAEFDLRRLYDRTLPGTARSADQPPCHDWQGGWHPCCPCCRYICHDQPYLIGVKNAQGVIVGRVETFQDRALVEQLQKKLQAKYTFEDIIGRSSAMMRLFDILLQISASTSTVLIEGPRCAQQCILHFYAL